MGDLVQQLVSELGIGQDQAEGGLGLIFNLLRDKLGGDFSQLESAVPGAAQLADRAPAGGGGGLLGMAGALLGGGAGDLAKLAEGFSGLGLDASMIGRFVPLIGGFLEQRGAGDLAARIGELLGGD